MPIKRRTSLHPKPKVSAKPVKTEITWSPKVTAFFSCQFIVLKPDGELRGFKHRTPAIRFMHDNGGILWQFLGVETEPGKKKPNDEPPTQGL